MCNLCAGLQSARACVRVYVSRTKPLCCTALFLCIAGHACFARLPPSLTSRGGGSGRRGSSGGRCCQQEQQHHDGPSRDGAPAGIPAAQRVRRQQQVCVGQQVQASAAAHGHAQALALVQPTPAVRRCLLNAASAAARLGGSKDAIMRDPDLLAGAVASKLPEMVDASFRVWSGAHACSCTHTRPCMYAAASLPARTKLLHAALFLLSCYCCFLPPPQVFELYAAAADPPVQYDYAAVQAACDARKAGWPSGELLGFHDCTERPEHVTQHGLQFLDAEHEQFALAHGEQLTGGVTGPIIAELSGRPVLVLEPQQDRAEGVVTVAGLLMPPPGTVTPSQLLSGRLEWCLQSSIVLYRTGEHYQAATPPPRHLVVRAQPDVAYMVLDPRDESYVLSARVMLIAPGTARCSMHGLRLHSTAAPDACCLPC